MKIAKAIRKAIARLKTNYLTVVSVLMILFTVLVVYWQDLSILFNEAMRSEAVSQIILIPFLFSYLVYRKRNEVKASLALENFRGKTPLASMSDIVGAAICLTAFLVYWYGSYTFYPLEYHIASLITFIMGITLILTNAKTLIILIFPILSLAFLMPPPSTVIYTAGGVLANVNTQGSYALLKTAGFPVTLSDKFGAPVISLNKSTVPIEFAVYQASSGLYSLIAFITFATFLVYITRGSLAKRVALFAFGLLILPILNITRISVIVAVAYYVGEEIAMGVVHTYSGWILIFGGMLLLLLIGEKIFHLEIFGRPIKASSCPECSDSLKKHETFCLNCGTFFKTSRVRFSRKFWTKVMILLIGSYIVTASIQAPAFAFAKGLALSSSPEANINVFPNITDYRLQFLYRDTDYERVAGQDISVIYAYLPQNGSALPIYVLVGVSSSISNLHNWEVSLIAWQTSRGLPPLVTQIESGDIQLTDNPRVIARYLAFLHPSNYTYVVLYWYQKAPFKTGLTVEPRYVRINLLYLTKNPGDSPQLKEKLITLGALIIDYWEPLRVQSLVSLGIPLLQLLLGSTVFAAIFIQTSQYALKERMKITTSKIFERLASAEEKLLYKTIKKLSEERKETTTQNIASVFEGALSKPVKTNELMGKLRNLEKHGIIRVGIINASGESKFVWKS